MDLEMISDAGKICLGFDGFFACLIAYAYFSESIISRRGFKETWDLGREFLNKPIFELYCESLGYRKPNTIS